MWVRIQSLPPESPLAVAVRDAQVNAEARDKVKEIDDLFDMVRNPKPATPQPGGETS